MEKKIYSVVSDKPRAKQSQEKNAYNGVKGDFFCRILWDWLQESNVRQWPALFVAAKSMLRGSMPWRRHSST